MRFFNVKTGVALLKIGVRASVLAAGLALLTPGAVIAEGGAVDKRTLKERLEEETARQRQAEANKRQQEERRIQQQQEKKKVRHVVVQRVEKPKNTAPKPPKPVEHPVKYHYSIACPNSEENSESTICVSDDPKLSELSEPACAEIGGHFNGEGICLSKQPCEEKEGQLDGQGECFIPAPVKPVKTEFKECDECPTMVVLPAGSFTMGSRDNEPGRDKDEGPLHNVDINYRFAMGKHEITRQEYAQFANSPQRRQPQECHAYDGRPLPGKTWYDPGFAQTSDEEPVVCVTWEDAQAYANWLSMKTGKQYALPTEAEWEYAARAGTDTARSWGDNPDGACVYANVADLSASKILAQAAVHQCPDGTEYTAPAGKYAANPFGLQDMLGNVWEWTQDCYHSSYEEAPADGAAWESAAGGECDRRVIRGGGSGMAGNPDSVRSANRGGLKIDHAYSMTGFRLVVRINP